MAVLLAGCVSAHTARIEKMANGRTAERIYNNFGGNVAAEMAAWRSRVNQHNIDHYIVDGMCASFCAFVALYAPESCYTKTSNSSSTPRPALAWSRPKQLAD